MVQVSDDEIIASDLNAQPTLAEAFERIRQNNGRGNLTDLRIQHEVLSYIENECGYNLSEYLDCSNRQFDLSEILERARLKYVPLLKSHKTIRNWLYFFVEHRVTMAEQRRNTFIRCRRRNVNRNTRTNRQFFTVTDIDALEWLVS